MVLQEDSDGASNPTGLPWEPSPSVAPMAEEATNNLRPWAVARVRRYSRVRMFWPDCTVVAIPAMSMCPGTPGRRRGNCQEGEGLAGIGNKLNNRERP